MTMYKKYCVAQFVNETKFMERRTLEKPSSANLISLGTGTTVYRCIPSAWIVVNVQYNGANLIRYPDDETCVEQHVQNARDPGQWPSYRVHILHTTDLYEEAMHWIKTATGTRACTPQMKTAELYETLSGEQFPSTSRYNSDEEDHPAETHDVPMTYTRRTHDVHTTYTRRNENSSDKIRIVNEIKTVPASSNSLTDPNTKCPIFNSFIDMLQCLVEYIYMETGKKIRLELKDVRISDDDCNLIKKMAELYIGYNVSDIIETNNRPLEKGENGQVEEMKETGSTSSSSASQSAGTSDSSINKDSSNKKKSSSRKDSYSKKNLSRNKNTSSKNDSSNKNDSYS